MYSNTKSRAKFRYGIALVGLTMAAQVNAQGFQTIPAVSTPTWEGTLEIGGSVTTGNSRAENAYVAGDIARSQGRWRTSLFGSYDYGKADLNGGAMGVTRDRGLLGLDARYAFTPRFYGYGLLKAERDRIADIKLRSTESLGVGFRAIAQPDMRLDLEAGPALRQTRYYSTPLNTEDFGIYGGAKYRWDINELVRLTNDLSATWTDARTIVNNEAGLGVRLSRNIGARFSHALTYNSDPLNSADEKVDTTTRASLVFGF